MKTPGTSLRKKDLPRFSMFLIGASTLAVLGFIVWASWAEIDQITRAPGQVIASSRNQLVQAPEGGVLQELLVKEGTLVKRGQPLANFERTRAESSFLEIEGKVAALRAAVARLRAEVLGGQPSWPAELARYPEIRASQQTLFVKRRAAFYEEIAALERSLGLVREELDMNLPLLKTGDVSKAEVLKLQRQVADVQSQITNRRNKYFQDSQAELVKTEEDLASGVQTMAARREQLGYTVVSSPMDGVVRNVRLTTRGGVAKPGEEILQIVPVDDDLLFEAKVRPADIAFIKPGLPSTVKLDAYDYSIYGALPGEVIYISADTLNEDTKSGDQPYYRVHVKTRGRDLLGAKSGRRVGERIEITPGMTATIEIKTGSNTVLRFLTKPVTKTISQSLGER